MHTCRRSTHTRQTRPNRWWLGAMLAAMTMMAQAQTAPQRQPSDAARPGVMSSLELKYQDFFREVAVLDQVEAGAASAGGKGGASATPWASLLGTEEVLLVKLVAAHCVRQLNENGVAARREFNDFRSAYPAGRAMKIPPQLRREHEEQARKIVDLHIEQVKEMLSKAAFAKLEKYVQQRPEPLSPVTPAPASLPQ